MYSQNYFRKGYYKLLFNMQGYEDGPPGDEYYSRARGENGGAHLRFPPFPAASARMGPSGQPARSAEQGEAAALLDSRQPLLVCAGGVNLQP